MIVRLGDHATVPSLMCNANTVHSDNDYQNTYYCNFERGINLCEIAQKLNLDCITIHIVIKFFMLLMSH